MYSIFLPKEPYICTPSPIVCCNSEPDLYEASSNLFYMENWAQKVVSRIAQIITDFVLFDDQEIAASIAQALVQSWEKSTGKSAHERIQEAIASVIEKAEALCQFEVKDDRHETWTMAHPLPLSAWVWQRKGFSISPIDTQPLSKSLITERLVPKEIRRYAPK